MIWKTKIQNGIPVTELSEGDSESWAALCSAKGERYWLFIHAETVSEMIEVCQSMNYENIEAYQIDGANTFVRIATIVGEPGDKIHAVKGAAPQ